MVTTTGTAVGDEVPGGTTTVSDVPLGFMLLAGTGGLASKVTVVPVPTVVKPVPVIITASPPVGRPEAGVILLIVGTST